MEAAGSVFPELAAGRTVFVLRLDPEKSPAGSPVSLYVREEASRTPLEPWEKARWWWSESKERPSLVRFGPGARGHFHIKETRPLPHSSLS